MGSCGARTTDLNVYGGYGLVMWCIRADRSGHPNTMTKHRAGCVVHIEPLCGAPGAHYVVRFGGGERCTTIILCGAILIRVGTPSSRVEKGICRVCGQPVSYVERRRRGGRVYLYGVHRSWVGGRRRIVKHYLGIEEGTGVEAREAPDEGRKPLEERVRELEARGLGKEDIARQLVQEHYPMREILRVTRVSLRALRRVRGGEEGTKPNADEIVIAAAEAKALEELKRWAGKETHRRLEELLALGRLLYGMRVRERAARRGMPLLDYIENALNFYDFWYGPVVELLNMGVLSMDGFINGDAVCYEAVTP